MPATTADMITKVRRLTRSPSTAQISDASVIDYLNDFYLYDFPEHLRLFSLRNNFVWYTEKNVDVYPLGQMFDTNVGYDVNTLNRLITIYRPVYVNGIEVYLTQSQEEFYSLYPKNQTLETVGTGDGVATNFTGTLANTPILRNSVTVSSFASPNDTLEGNDKGNGTISNLVTPGRGFSGTINYTTGAFNVTAAQIPDANEPVTISYFPFQASRPQVVLFFNNSFFLRPVPDKSYKVEMEASRRPFALSSVLLSLTPELEQWWQYISYGAAKKIFEDRSDIESVQQIMPEFKQQELLVLRRTIDTQTKERTSTIYTQQTSPNAAWWNFLNNNF